MISVRMLSAERRRHLWPNVLWTEQKAHYIRNRGLDDDYYRRLITEYLQKYSKASRNELDELLFPKLPEVLTEEQKEHKVRNLLQALRRAGFIRNAGSRATPIWILGDNQ